MKKIIVLGLLAAWIWGVAPASAMIFCVPGGNNPDPACEGPNPPAHCGEYDPTYGGRLIAIVKDAFAKFEVSASNLIPTKATK